MVAFELFVTTDHDYVTEKTGLFMDLKFSATETLHSAYHILLPDFCWFCHSLSNAENQTSLEVPNTIGYLAVGFCINLMEERSHNGAVWKGWDGERRRKCTRVGTLHLICWAGLLMLTTLITTVSDCLVQKGSQITMQFLIFLTYIQLRIITQHWFIMNWIYQILWQKGSACCF